jgi:hypothetical protein
MPPPKNEEQSADLVDLICDLIELPSRRIRAGFRKARGAEAERLITMGLVRLGSAPKAIGCRACDEDHPATPEFDSAAGRYFHFCPVAGRVDVDPRDLETLEICTRAVVDLLIAAFPVLPAIGRELVAERIWHLGEAVIGGTSLTLIFACRIGSHRALGTLARAVATVPATQIGMIVTSSPLPDPQLVLPNHYTVVSLRDITSADGNRVEINRDRIAAHIRMQLGDRARPRARGGRPSDHDLVVDAHRSRRNSGEPFVSIAAEARAIVSDLEVAHPDRPPPGVSTVRKHLSKLRSPRP